MTNRASVKQKLTMTKTPIRFTNLIAAVLLSTSCYATFSQTTFKTPILERSAKPLRDIWGST